MFFISFQHCLSNRIQTQTETCLAVRIPYTVAQATARRPRHMRKPCPIQGSPDDHCGRNSRLMMWRTVRVDWRAAIRRH